MPIDWSDIEIVGGPKSNAPAAAPPVAPVYNLDRGPLGYPDLSFLPKRTPEEQAQDIALMQEEEHPLKQAAKGFGTILGKSGRAMRDILGAYMFEAIGEPTLQAQQLGISSETLKKLGATDVEPEPDIPKTPLEQGLERLPTVPRIISETPYAMAEQTPRFAAVAGLQAAGVPTPIAAGAVFGTTEQGFDPKAAAVATFIPFAGKYSGEIAGALIKRFGVDSTTAINIVKGSAATVGPSAALLAEGEREISKLPKEQQHEARINMYANILGQSALGPMGARYEKEPGKIPVTFRTVRQPSGVPIAERIRTVDQELAKFEVQFGARDRYDRETKKLVPIRALNTKEQELLDLRDKLSEQQAKGETYAVEPSTTPSVRPVRDQPREGIQQVPVEGGVAPTDERGRQEIQPKPEEASGQIAEQAAMEPDAFVKQFGKGTEGLTARAYQLGEQLTSADVTALEAARDAAIARMRELQKAGDLQTGMAEGMRNQFFNEALKWRQALDEAKQTGAKTVADFAALEKKYGVGGVRRGEDLMAASQRAAPKAEPVYDLSEAEKELKAQPGREFTPAIRDTSGKVTEGNSHDELRQQGIKGTPGFTDRNGNFVTMLDAARQKLFANTQKSIQERKPVSLVGMTNDQMEYLRQIMPEGYVKEGNRYVFKERPLTPADAVQLLREEGVTLADANDLLSGKKTVKEVVEGNFKVTPSFVAVPGGAGPRGHAEAFIEGYNQAIERLTDIVSRTKAELPQFSTEGLTEPQAAAVEAFNKTGLFSKALAAYRQSFAEAGLLYGGDARSERAVRQILARATPVKPLPVGPGAARPEDVGTKTQLASLIDSVRTLAEQGKKPQLQRAYTLGEKLNRWKDSASNAVEGLKAAAKYSKEWLQAPARWDDFKRALGLRQVALSESAMTIEDFMEKSLRAVPNALDREGISNWVDHGGDRRSLLQALSETDPKYEAGYEKALTLSPEHVTVARNIQNYFESRLQDAIDAGILEEGLENYIHRLYEKDTPWKRGMIAELRSGVYTGKPSFARQRVFRFDWEAEKAGYKVVKDFARRVAQYDFSLNKAIADRQFVKATLGDEAESIAPWTMPDGKPAIGVGGIGQKVGGVGTDAAFLVKPNFRGDKLVTADGRLYIPFDHPALRKWKWVEQDAEGSAILVQGDVYVHPDAMPQIKAVFGKSILRQYAPTRFLMDVSATAKQTMLDLSGFHPVQITVHGWEHRTDVPLGRWSARITGREFQPIDLSDPVQRSLVAHGVTVIDYNAHQLFSEGVSGGGSSLFRHIPGVGPKLAEYNHWLFSDYIPRLKMSMAKHALERNRKAYAKELADGRMSEDQLLHLTANQANAAFGELNYEMMGRNRSLQDFLRLALLAPDFLEARATFAGQAAKTAVGGYGQEQVKALAFGAVTMYITARIANRFIDGQYHWEPEHVFDVVHNGRAYSIRTVQGDIIHAAFNPRSFAYTRLNPVTTRTLFEAVTGRDQFGRPRSAFEQVKDFAGTVVPISARGLFRGREQKLWESFMNAFGATERRATASDTIYKMVDRFKKAHKISEPGEFIYDPDKDPYRGIKLALMFDKPEVAAQEMKLALDTGKTDWKHLSNYFDNFGKRPFTGSKENEKLFWQSLSEDQRHTYNEALAERKKMRTNAGEAFRLFRDQLNKQEEP